MARGRYPGRTRAASPGVEGDIPNSRAKPFPEPLGINAQRRGRADEGAGDFVEGPVAPDGDHRVDTIGHRAPRQFVAVARPSVRVKAMS
jgi:hypothetical protein